MQMQRTFIVIVVAVLALAYSARAGEHKVDLSSLPAPAQAAVEKWLAGGTIKSITQEEEDGKVIYDVEATVNGQHAEADVAADGTVLTTEVEVAFNSLPQAVQDAAGKYFGDTKDLKASKELEGSKTMYEIEGKKATLKLDESGKILEEEKAKEKNVEEEKE